MNKPDSDQPSDQDMDTLTTLYKQGQFQKVIILGTELAKRYPDVALIASVLAAALSAVGRNTDAAVEFRRVVQLEPDNPRAHYNLGAALLNSGDLSEAQDCFQRVITLDPAHTAAHVNLANLFIRSGNYDAAVTNYQRALEIEPDNAEIYFQYGIALSKNLGHFDEAIASFNRALAIRPDYAEVHNNLGIAFHRLGQFDNAVASYRHALALKPDYAEAHNNLGIALIDLGRRIDAIASYRRAVECDPNYLSARCTMLYHLTYCCDWEQIGSDIETQLKSLEFGSTAKEISTPFSLLALVDDAAFQLRVAEAYTRVMSPPNPALGPLAPTEQPRQRIKIGYYSADFHDHPTMYLMAELFERHDRDRFEVHAFSFGPDRQDTMRQRLLRSVEHFHDVRLQGDRDVAALSRSLGIDIAVDLKGYTKHARTGIFAYRAAPIQVNYLGYPGTMGAPYIDYLVADPVLIPPESQQYYTEKIVYLPDSYQVNDSQRRIAEVTPTRAEAGLPETGFVFCCFNNSYKITPDVFAIWMRLLARVPGSVLWLLQMEPLAVQNLRRAAQQQGIDPDRLVFAGKLPLADHLARCRLADLFVDTFNYNAHTTASDALWVGLPIVTKLGQSFASRVAGSLLQAVGLPELVTTSQEDYEALALRLATHADELHRIKEKLTANRDTAPLFDAARFTGHLEQAYNELFRRVEASIEPEHYYV